MHDALTGLANRKLLIAADCAVAGRGGRAHGGTTSRCACSTSTGSRRSTTRSATRSATGCCELAASRLARAVRPERHRRPAGRRRVRVLLPDVRDAGGRASRSPSASARALSEPFHLDGMHCELEASIGIALHPEHADSSPARCCSAPTSRCTRPRRSAPASRLYRPERDSTRRDRLGLLGALRRAIENGELELHYQPKVRAARPARSVGVEALVRWRHPERGLVLPGRLPRPGRAVRPDAPAHRPRDRQGAGARPAQWWQPGIAVPVAVNVSVRDLHRRERSPTSSAGLLARRTACRPGPCSWRSPSAS